MNGVYTDMVDRVTKNFRKRSAQGEVIVTPMTRNSINISTTFSPSTVNRIGTCSGTTLKSQTWQCYSAKWFPMITLSELFLGVDHPDIAPLVTEAITQARARASTPPIETLVEVAEARKTIESLRGSADEFRSFLEKQKSSNEYLAWLERELDVTTGRRSERREGELLKKQARALARKGWQLDRFIASQWLKLRYAVMPVVLTGQAALREYKQRKVARPERQTYRSFKYREFTPSTFSTTVGASGSYFTGTVDTTVTRRVEVRAGALFDLTKGRPLTGTGLHDTVPAAWELVPWSFVADWFGNFGDYLRVAFPYVGLKELGSWVTVVETVEIRSVENISSAGVANYTANPGSSQVMIIGVRKTRIPSPPSGVGLRRSTVNLGLQLTRMVDAAALAVGLLGNKSPLTKLL